MRVTVDESWKQPFPAEIDAFCLLPDFLLDIRPTANCNDLVYANRYCFRVGMFCLRRKDSGVVENALGCVIRLRACRRGQYCDCENDQPKKSWNPHPYSSLNFNAHFSLRSSRALGDWIALSNVPTLSQTKAGRGIPRFV
jgi:hypothetical protein